MIGTMARYAAAVAIWLAVAPVPVDPQLLRRRGPAGLRTRQKGAGPKGRAAKGRWAGTAGKIRP